MSDSEFTIGDGTIVRVAALASSRTRPSDASFKVIPGGTKADLDRGASDKTIRTFDSGMAEDGRVTSTNWMINLAGVNKDTTAFKAAYAILEAAWRNGSEVWCERQRPTDTVWKGGPCSVMTLPEPTSADNIVDWSAGLKGRGVLVETPITP